MYQVSYTTVQICCPFVGYVLAFDFPLCLDTFRFEISSELVFQKFRSFGSWKYISSSNILYVFLQLTTRLFSLLHTSFVSGTGLPTIVLWSVIESFPEFILQWLISLILMSYIKRKFSNIKWSYEWKRLLGKLLHSALYLNQWLRHD